MSSASSSTHPSTTCETDSPLHPPALFQTLHGILPPNATPLLTSPADLVMALFHAAMLRFGFRFLGLGEAGNGNGTNQQPDVAEGETPPLPADWNGAGDMFSFRYRHSQSSLTFLLKGVKVGSKLVVHGMGIEDEKLHTLELSLPTFISPAFPFPYTTTQQQQQLGGGGESALQSAFASADRLHAVLTEFRVKIVQQLIPGLDKPGFEEWKNRPEPTTTSTHAPPYHPIPSPHTDPHFPYGSGSGGSHLHPTFPGRSPYTIGDTDLDPLAASPGLVFPHTGGLSQGGSMFVGPDHPMFHHGGGGVPRPDRYLPPGAVPPGARFDPIGPFGPRPGGGPGGPPLGGPPPPGRGGPRGPGFPGGGMPFR
ncbi:hypothetical protein PhCBS80983_g06187 [Powellomyces hirtus]|uniref:Uncharacterized protein n=1 Tax=Powellomyces hirtus TaxID=109895 RepID=A0A507DPX7_9FUNG|nr:hypothetical protein PhCBS80983_g06187 [Powellomyces hirtus]